MAARSESQLVQISGDQLELGQRMIKVAYKIGEKSASDDDEALNASSKFCKERERQTRSF